MLLHDAVATAASVGQRDVIGAFTLGGAREIGRWHGFEGAVGADIAFFAVPSVLQAAYGAHPVSFQLSFQLRPPVGSMGRMWNMRMAQSMAAGHSH